MVMSESLSSHSLVTPNNRHEKIPSRDYLCTEDSYMKGGHVYIHVRSVRYNKFATLINFKGL
jgi:hypothetical protein